MSLVAALAADNRAAMAVATVLEQALGGDVILAVGTGRTEPIDQATLPAGPTRAVVSSFVGELGGAITVVVNEAAATALEAAAADEQMLTTLGPVVTEAVGIVLDAGSVRARGSEPVEVTTAEFLRSNVADDCIWYPLLDGNTRVATFVVSVGGATITEEVIETAVAEPVAAPQVSAHEFRPLQPAPVELVDARPLALLHDVEMGVTAELGRRRMTVRELLSLTPGSVIELDRAAGSPVDVLVNGTLIAKGEVVVIDEEFGIRISEIIIEDDVITGAAG